MTGAPDAVLGATLARLSAGARLLPCVTPVNAAAERARAVDSLAAGVEPGEPRWVYPPRPDVLSLRRDLEAARRALDEAPAPDLHAARLDELSLELDLLEALPDPRAVVPLIARRHGTPADLLADGTPVLERARAWLRQQAPGPAAAAVPPELAAIALRAGARAARLDVDVRIDATLASLAAAGDRTLFLAARSLTAPQVMRLCAHELLGHLTSAVNARAQPLRLLELGTAGSFEDQEGLCLWLERATGTLDGYRVQTLAARVLATDAMLRGSGFGATCRLAHELLGGIAPDDAVRIAERCHRAGGAAARDVGYVLGLDRVENALAAEGLDALQWLRAGRVSVQAIPNLRRLAATGLARGPLWRPDTQRVMNAAAAELGRVTTTRR